MIKPFFKKLVFIKIFTIRVKNKIYNLSRDFLKNILFFINKLKSLITYLYKTLYNNLLLIINKCRVIIIYLYKSLFSSFLLVINKIYFLIRKFVYFYKSLKSTFLFNSNILLLKTKKIILFRKIDSWNFTKDFDLLIGYAERDHDLLEKKGYKLIKNNPEEPKGYAYIEACLRFKVKEGHYNVGMLALANGNLLIQNGSLKQGKFFYKTLQILYPSIFTPYAILYDLIYEKQKQYRKKQKANLSCLKKKLLISFSIWGEKYINLFVNYSIPSMLSDNNLPKILNVRNIIIDIYISENDKEKLENKKIFLYLKSICEINFIEFPEILISCEEYKRNHGVLRYMIYGGFHHLSVEKAQLLNADIMCIGPDNIHADGSLYNYIKFIDDGYPLVLFTAMRCQAEYLEKVFDRIKDKNTLKISSQEMVNYSIEYIHHNFMQYVMHNKKGPEWQSQYFIPHKNGVYIRGFHLHPVVISSRVLNKKIDWDYSTADGNLVKKLFPNKEDWKTFKVIENSEDGIMIDMTYKQNQDKQKLIDFDENSLNIMRDQFTDNHLWNFGKEVNYKTDKNIVVIKGYKYNENNNLKLVEYPIEKVSAKIKSDIISWYSKQ